MKRFIQPKLKHILCFMIFSFYFLNSQLIAQCGTGNCDVCNAQLTISGVTNANILSGNSTIPGPIEPSSEGFASDIELDALGCGVITMTATVSFDWYEGDTNSWLHGVSFSNSPGWLAAQGNNPGAGWLFLQGIVGDCSGDMYGAGFYWDAPTDDSSSNCAGFGDVAGDPSDNFGINPNSCCPSFAFSLEFCPLNTGTVTESITFNLTEDGTSGGWNDTAGCDFDLTYGITINSVGIQLPQFITSACPGDLAVIDAGFGCNSYVWDHGAVGSQIQVNPMVSTTYCVQAVSGAGCQTNACVSVIVEPDNEVPVFVNPPASIVLECTSPIPSMMDLVWTDNCDGSGTVSGTEIDNSNACAGGTIIRTWTYTDMAGNQAVYNQVITILADACEINNGLPINLEVEGNACVRGVISAEEAMQLKPLTAPPANPSMGLMYFDANTQKLRVWDGAAWQDCW